MGYRMEDSRCRCLLLCFSGTVLVVCGGKEEISLENGLVMVSSHVVGGVDSADGR